MGNSISANLSKSLDQNDISGYLRKIRKFPLLSHEDEEFLANEWISKNSYEAAHKLINAHLRLVVKISMKFRGYGLPLNELISEGNIGLIQSLNRFDPSKGFRLSTYAMWWIRASIQEFILHSWSLVKIGTTAAQKKLFFNLRSLKGKLKALEDGDLPPELVTEIAEKLEVSENDVVDMNRRMAGHDHSLNNPYSADNDDEWINGLPDQNALLSHEDEEFLANEWISKNSYEAAHKLINAHLRLVVKISMKFRGYGLPLNELISEGNIGLIQSLNRFDPSKGFRLSTYAMWWIRASIQEFILHSWSLVKIGTTAAQKKLFFNLRSLKGKLKALEDGDLPPELVTEIAEKLEVSENDVVDMNRRMAGHDHSLNNPYSADNDDEWINGLPDENENHENKFLHKEELFKRREMLKTALKNLDDRERRIITQRRLVDDPLTLDELSKSFGISRERVRQVEVRAFEKLRKVVKNIDYKNKNH